MTSSYRNIEKFCKQVRKLRWSVAFVILQNCDLVTSVPPGQCAAKQPLTKIGQLCSSKHEGKGRIGFEYRWQYN